VTVPEVSVVSDLLDCVEGVDRLVLRRGVTRATVTGVTDVFKHLFERVGVFVGPAW